MFSEENVGGNEFAPKLLSSNKKEMVIRWKFEYFFCFLFFICGCGEKTAPNRVFIKWQEILNTGKPVDFCQIDSVANNYILSFSYPFTSHGGGFQIVRSVNKDNILANTILVQRDKMVISNLSVVDSCLAYVRVDFLQNTLNSVLLRCCGKDCLPQEVPTPLESISKYFILKSIVVATGYFHGYDAIFRTFDGRQWAEMNILNFGYKGIDLLESINNSNQILCIGDKSYDHADCEIMIVDFGTNVIKHKQKIRSGYRYIKLMRKNGYYFGLEFDNSMSVYAIKNGTVEFQNKFELPHGMYYVRNMFVDDYLYIMTCEQKSLNTNPISWISYDKGKNWDPFYQEKECQLVYNSFGRLFMIDHNNNIRMAQMDIVPK